MPIYKTNQQVLKYSQPSILQEKENCKKDKEK